MTMEFFGLCVVGSTIIGLVGLVIYVIVEYKNLSSNTIEHQIFDTTCKRSVTMAWLSRHHDIVEQMKDETKRVNGRLEGNIE